VLQVLNKGIQKRQIPSVIRIRIIRRSFNEENLPFLKKSRLIPAILKTMAPIEAKIENKKRRKPRDDKYETNE
jgi:hypothetical protein